MKILLDSHFGVCYNGDHNNFSYVLNIVGEYNENNKNFI